MTDSGIDSEDTDWETWSQNQGWVMLCVWTWLWAHRGDTPCEGGGSHFILSHFTTGIKVSSALALGSALACLCEAET